MKLSLSPYAKAATAGITVSYGLFELATSPESAGGTGVTSAEWVKIAVFGLLAILAVWAVPNKAKDDEGQDDAGGDHRAI